MSNIKFEFYIDFDDISLPISIIYNRRYKDIFLVFLCFNLDISF